MRGHEDDSQADGVPALEKNLDAIKHWEQSLLEGRSAIERMSDWVTSTAASGPVLIGHLVWFGVWLTVNFGLIDSIEPFDIFPFPLLTTIVSLEAIFLALFVLASQNRLSRHSDKRAHLDLQINLLTEREMTAVLRLLRDIATHQGVKGSVALDELRDLAKETDIETVTTKLETLPECGDAPTDDSVGSAPPTAAVVKQGESV